MKNNVFSYLFLITLSMPIYQIDIFSAEAEIGKIEKGLAASIPSTQARSRSLPLEIESAQYNVFDHVVAAPNNKEAQEWLIKEIAHDKYNALLAKKWIGEKLGNRMHTLTPGELDLIKRLVGPTISFGGHLVNPDEILPMFYYRLDDINQKDYSLEDVALLKTLLDAGANHDLIMYDGNPFIVPIIIRAAYNYENAFKMVKMLVNKGANIDVYISSQQGRLPLVALANRNISLLEFLLSRAKNPNPSIEGHTLLEIMQQNKASLSAGFDSMGVDYTNPDKLIAEHPGLKSDMEELQDTKHVIDLITTRMKK